VKNASQPFTARRCRLPLLLPEYFVERKKRLFFIPLGGALSLTRLTLLGLYCMDYTDLGNIHWLHGNFWEISIAISVNRKVQWAHLVA